MTLRESPKVIAICTFLATLSRSYECACLAIEEDIVEIRPGLPMPTDHTLRPVPLVGIPAGLKDGCMPPAPRILAAVVGPYGCRIAGLLAPEASGAEAIR
jgi:hypothetical protein